MNALKQFDHIWKLYVYNIKVIIECSNDLLEMQDDMIKYMEKAIKNSK